LNGRPFDLEAEAWLNTVANYRRSYEPDGRQLISLPKVLDCAAGALVRIEALRAAIEAARDTESEQDATIELVAQRYELLLSDITYLADVDTIAAARVRTDADASTVLTAAVAEAWIEQVRATALDWVGATADAGACASMDALKAALDSTPLSLEAPDEGESDGTLLDKMAADTALGEIVDTLRVHVLQAAWKVLRASHRPQETAEPTRPRPAAPVACPCADHAAPGASREEPADLSARSHPRAADRQRRPGKFLRAPHHKMAS